MTLNGEGSSDANGIASYRWVLGDGTQVNASKVTHTFASTGAFAAVLTVQDPAGNSGTETVWVVVNDKPAVTVTPTPTPTAIPTAKPTPTATPTTNPTSTSTPETSSGALPDWAWTAAIITIGALCGVIGTVLFKQKRAH